MNNTVTYKIDFRATETGGEMVVEMGNQFDFSYGQWSEVRDFGFEFLRGIQNVRWQFLQFRIFLWSNNCSPFLARHIARRCLAQCTISTHWKT